MVPKLRIVVDDVKRRAELAEQGSHKDAKTTEELHRCLAELEAALREATSGTTGALAATGNMATAAEPTAKAEALRGMRHELAEEQDVRAMAQQEGQHQTDSDSETRHDITMLAMAMLQGPANL